MADVGGASKVRQKRRNRAPHVPQNTRENRYFSVNALTQIEPRLM
jgi:hypothetical protein